MRFAGIVGKDEKTQNFVGDDRGWCGRYGKPLA